MSRLWSFRRVNDTHHDQPETPSNARSLDGLRILVTRPRGQAQSSADLLRARGAEVVFAPLVEIVPVEPDSPLDEAVRNFDRFDWLVVTSTNGVEALVERFQRHCIDLSGRRRRPQIAAIGGATAKALEQIGLTAEITPDRFGSEALLDQLCDRVVGQSVLIAQADRARPLLYERLVQVAIVERVVAYRTVDVEVLPETVRTMLEQHLVDWIPLTSPAIVRQLNRIVSESLRNELKAADRSRPRLAAISPLTADQARLLGWHVQVIAEPHDWGGLVEAIVRENGTLG